MPDVRRAKWTSGTFFFAIKPRGFIYNLHLENRTEYLRHALFYIADLEASMPVVGATETVRHDFTTVKER